MALLTRDAFLATMGQDRTALGPEELPPFDFWPYVEGIPASHLGGFDFSSGRVPHVWATDRGQWQHVLISSNEPNVFLVVVLRTRPPGVHGHHLLDLNELYGTAPGRQ